MTGPAPDQWVSLPSRPLARRALAIARRIDRFAGRVAAAHAPIAGRHVAAAGAAGGRRGAVVRRRRADAPGSVIAPVFDVQPIVPVYERSPAEQAPVPVDAGVVATAERPVLAQEPATVARREAERPVLAQEPATVARRETEQAVPAQEPASVARREAERPVIAPRPVEAPAVVAREPSVPRPEAPKVLRSEPEPAPADLPPDMRFLWDVWQREKPGGRGVLERSRGARIVEGPAPEPEPGAAPAPARVREPAPVGEEIADAPVQVAREAVRTEPAPESVREAERAVPEPAALEPATLDAVVPEPGEEVSSVASPSTGPLRISRTPKRIARAVEDRPEEAPFVAPEPLPEPSRSGAEPLPEPPRSGAEPRLDSVPADAQPAVARLSTAQLRRAVTGEAPVRVNRRPRPIAVADPRRTADDAPPAPDAAPPPPDDPPGHPEVARVAEPAVGLLRRAVSRAFGRPRGDDAAAPGRPMGDDVAAPVPPAADDGAAGSRPSGVDGVPAPIVPSSVVDVSGSAEQGRPAPVRLSRLRSEAPADPPERQWVAPSARPSSAPTPAAFVGRVGLDSLDQLPTLSDAAFTHGAELVDAVSSDAEAAIADLADHALSSIPSPDAHSSSPSPSPSSSPSAAPSPGGRRDRRPAVHKPSPSGRARHAHASRHGDGSAAGGAVGGDPDHLYRELLHRLREEREQLGLVVDEPF